MDKKYTSSINRRSPRPRSKRLREQGIGGHVSGAAATAPSGNDFGLQDSLLNFRTGVNTLLVPCDSTGAEITWEEALQIGTDGNIKAKSLKAKVALWSVESLAGKGLAPAGGSGGGGGGSLFGLYTDTTWVSTPAEDDALSAVLGKSLHARVSVLEGAGYLTGITKAMVEAVLTGDVTSHTHSLLSKPADNRSVATTPNDYNGKFAFTGMKYRSTIGVPGTGDYVNGFGWRGWDHSSGGKAWEVFGDNADLYVRCGGTTTWEAWRKILTDGNYASTLDGHYLARSGGSMTNTNLVNNLNAELLGGLTCDQVRSTAMRFFGWMQPTNTTNADLNLLTYGMARNYWGFDKWANAPSGMRFGAAITFSQYDYENLYGQLAWDVNHLQDDVTRNLYWRVFATAKGGTDKWGGWKQIAFTDSLMFAHSSHVGNVDLNTITTSGIYGTGGSCTNAPAKTPYGQLLVLHGQGDTPIAQMMFSYNVNGLVYVRAGSPTNTGGKGSFGAWEQLALVSGNVASATKLQTARSIWGQSFDGTAAISGELQHVTALRFDSGNALVEGLGNAWNLWSVNGFQFFPTMSATVSALSITANGRVGVNMYSPQYDFDVTGVIHASGEICSDKAIGGKGMTSSSDIRLKHIIGDVELSFEAILNSPSKRFTWLGDPTKTERIGTIAQYWLPILPQVVYTAPDGYYAVDYGTLANAKADTIAHVVADLVERINKLESQLKSLPNA